MTFPIDLQIGAIRIPSHLLFEVLAFGIGFAYYQSLRRRRGDAISGRMRMSIVLAAAFGALVGSRLIGLLEHPDMLTNPPGIWAYFAGKTIVGGLVGGLVGVELIKKIHGEKKSSGDLFTFPLILAMGIGRIGCFLTGAADRTTGLASNLPWAFDQGSGHPQHPTSLYEIAFLAALWIALASSAKARTRTGQPLASGTLFRRFMVCYLAYRLLIDFLKPRQPLLIGLTAIQLTCLLTLLYYAGLCLTLRRKSSQA